VCVRACACARVCLCVCVCVSVLCGVWWRCYADPCRLALGFTLTRQASVKRPYRILRPEARKRQVSVDLCSGERELSDYIDEGRLLLEGHDDKTEARVSGKDGVCSEGEGAATNLEQDEGDGDIEFETVSRNTWSIMPDEPLSARAR
jgi:hypothetical protein